jgi:hypothetical protein
MNDNELDEILNQWSAPSAPPSLRKRALPNRDRQGVGPRKRLIAAVVLAAAVFFFIVTQASPQPPAPVPWTVDSEFLRYADNGSSSIEMYMTSWESTGVNSNEVFLSRSMPGNPFKTMLGQAMDVTLPALARFHMHVLGAVNPGMLAKIDQMKRSQPPGISYITGCDPGGECLVLDHYGFTKAAAGCIDSPVVGRATILNHPTEAVRDRWTEHGRMTLWLAPDLACFALKVTYEAELPDGTFHLVAAKQALKVTINR